MWQLAGILTASLLGGCALGWAIFQRADVRSPSVWVSMIILLVGSVGGPALLYRMLGAGTLSFAAAVAIAGFAAGVTFWPMAKPQGTKEWL